MDLWLVGKYIKGEFPNIVWEFVGVFNSESKALKVCKNHRDYFIAPISLNEEAPEESREFPDLYYPNDN